MRPFLAACHVLGQVLPNEKFKSMTPEASEKGQKGFRYFRWLRNPPIRGPSRLFHVNNKAEINSDPVLQLAAGL